MNIDEVLLTDDELNKCVEPAFSFIPPDEAFETMIMKAQCLKLLEWLKKEGLLMHEINIRYQGTPEFKAVCVKTCKLCELEAMLREV